MQCRHWLSNLSLLEDVFTLISNVARSPYYINRSMFDVNVTFSFITTLSADKHASFRETNYIFMITFHRRTAFETRVVTKFC